MIRFVSVFATGAVGVWLGFILFFSFVTAPRVFGVLERDRAGDVVNEIFPTYYILGAALGVVALTAGVVRSLVEGFGLYLGLYMAWVSIGIFVAVFSRAYLVPRIKRADEHGDGDSDAFEKYHGASVKLNSVMLVVVVAALVFWHV